jgi:hypothetical protein
MGPPHNRRFLAEMMVNEEVVGHGMGKSKNEAHQAAAKIALTVLNQWPVDEEEPIALLKVPKGYCGKTESHYSQKNGARHPHRGC